MKPEISWNDILKKAVTEPGSISTAYSSFHNYSLGNQMLALFQCHIKGIPAGPISTYPGWQSKGRQVRKGEKALSLYMPITRKRKAETEDSLDDVYTTFILKSAWFVLSQTDGEDFKPQSLPDWNKDTALSQLGITEEQFTITNGNVQGYAEPGRKVAISPIAVNPNKTLFHELGHVMLGHCEEGQLTDDERTPRTLREVEAESVALLCCESLGLPGAEFSRGYIQNWAPGLSEIPEKSCQKIFKAADAILKAGRGEVKTEN